MVRMKRYRIGLGRRRKLLFSWALTGLGGAWLLVEPTTFFFPPAKQFVEANSGLTFLGFLVTGLAFAAWRAREPQHISFRLRSTNTVIEIGFGDLFAQITHLAIPVNEFFDGELGNRVSDRSVHGQFIARFFNSDARRFEAACDAALKGSEPDTVDRPGGRRKKYPIGTTAVVAIGGARAFLFASSTTDIETAKARSDLPTMWGALEELWRSVRTSSNGQGVSLPLVGAGQSAVGFEPQHLLRIILLSILVATREREISKRIAIVLHEDIFDQMDLRAVQAEWS
jgi:hypothetical protein